MKINQIRFNQNSIVTANNKLQGLNRSQIQMPADSFQLSGLSKTANVSMDKISFKQNFQLVQKLFKQANEVSAIIIDKSTETIPNELIVNAFTGYPPNFKDLIKLCEKAASYKDLELVQEVKLFQPLETVAELHEYHRDVSVEVLNFVRRYLTDENLQFGAQESFLNVAINSGKELNTVLNIINEQIKHKFDFPMGINNVTTLLKNAGKFGDENLKLIQESTFKALKECLKGKTGDDLSLIKMAIKNHPLGQTHGHLVGNEF
jgi:hypothetical protein